MYQFELVRYININTYVWTYICHNSSTYAKYVYILLWVELGLSHFGSGKCTESRVRCYGHFSKLCNLRNSTNNDSSSLTMVELKLAYTLPECALL